MADMSGLLFSQNFNRPRDCKSMVKGSLIAANIVGLIGASRKQTLATGYAQTMPMKVQIDCACSESSRRRRASLARPTGWRFSEAGFCLAKEDVLGCHEVVSKEA